MFEQWPALLAVTWLQQASQMIHASQTYTLREARACVLKALKKSIGFLVATRFILAWITQYALRSNVLLSRRTESREPCYRICIFDTWSVWLEQRLPFVVTDAEGQGSYSILIVDWRRSLGWSSWFVGMFDDAEGSGLGTLVSLIENGLPGLGTNYERRI